MTARKPKTPLVEQIRAAKTIEARWALVLNLWHAEKLPTPEAIKFDGIMRIDLPDNERGQVDTWTAALGMPPARVLRGPLPPMSDGQPCMWTRYTSASDAGWPHLEVQCDLNISADADEHWTPDPAPSLAAAAAAVVQLVGAR